MFHMSCLVFQPGTLNPKPLSLTYRICPTEVVVCPTGMALSLPLSNKIRMVAEDARLPRVSPSGPINYPGAPK